MTPKWKRSKTVTADDLILYTENPEDATRKLLEVINEFGNMAIYKNEIFFHFISFSLTMRDQKEN